jgi:hypothetical protein
MSPSEHPILVAAVIMASPSLILLRRIITADCQAYPVSSPHLLSSFFFNAAFVLAQRVLVKFGAYGSQGIRVS